MGSAGMRVYTNLQSRAAAALLSTSVKSFRFSSVSCFRFFHVNNSGLAYIHSTGYLSACHSKGFEDSSVSPLRRPFKRGGINAG